MIDRRYINFFDFISLFLIIILSLVGLLFVYSATFRIDQPYSIYFKKQLFGCASGLLIYFICCFIDFRTLQRWAYFLYFLTIVLLIFTMIKGSVALGGQRWISLGFFKFQPSEIAKLIFPGFFTYYLFTEKDSFDFSVEEFLPMLAMLGFSALLILKQPDLGTAMIISLSGILLFWMAGIGKKFFFWSSIFLLITAPVLYKCLKPYQKQRIAVFMGYGDSKKERYQIEQSVIAIGSGGLAGKGFLNGTQNKLQFLPESRTDFIFSVLCEEWGFLGAILIIFLYILLFIRLFYVVSTITNFFVQLLAIGLILHIIISTMINIGMVIGLLPIVGIPLPFMSYGISHLWITFASLGWFNSISMRRFYISVR
ncbi:rod shape-determining protein RodA [Candidatus Dependentiae bacterium]|nr:rod shape-determining protein RodA [Candidatus Dependentiae bacterium]